MPTAKMSDEVVDGSPSASAPGTCTRASPSWCRPGSWSRAALRSGAAIPKSRIFTPPWNEEHQVRRRDVAVNDARAAAPSAIATNARSAAPGKPGARCPGWPRRARVDPSSASFALTAYNVSPWTCSMAMKKLSSIIAELEDLYEVRVRQHAAQLRLVDEHPDEGGILRQMREHPLDHQPCAGNPPAPVATARKTSAIPPSADPFEKVVLPERRGVGEGRLSLGSHDIHRKLIP